MVGHVPTVIEIIVGDGFNSHLDSSLDNLGGRIESKPSVKKINETMTANDLIDISSTFEKSNLLGRRKSPNKTTPGLLVR